MRNDHLGHAPMEPFLDFMATLIMALAATAAWGQVNTLVAADQVWAGRDRTGPCPTSASVSPYWSCTWTGPTTDVATLGQVLRLDRGWHARWTQIVIVTDDGVPYGRLLEAIDLARGLGYENVMLGGGPPARALPRPSRQDLRP